MTHSILRQTHRCMFPVLSGLLLFGCGSDDTGSKADTGIRDTSQPPDAVVGNDAPSGPEAGPETGKDSNPSAVEVAPPAAEVAPPVPDTATIDRAPAVDRGGGMDGPPAAIDAAPIPSIDAAASSVQRIIDPQVPAADMTSLAADNAAFAFAAYQQLITTNGNLVFSPASISIALAMTYAGAAGTTASEMAATMRFKLPQAQLHPAMNALDQALASRGEGKLGADGGPMRLHIVNALWAEQSYIFRSDFLDGLAANYGARVNTLDFQGAPEPSRLVINAWVAKQTEDRILDLLPEKSIDSSTKLVLTNAVYFNAQWRTLFEGGETRDNVFVLLDGSQVTTKFMNTDQMSLPVHEGANYKAVSLPYADERLSLIVVAPDAGQFAPVEAALDASSLQTMVTNMTTKRVQFSMPRFRIETGTELKELLKALGMNAAFDSGAADFSGMDGTRNLYIDRVIHKAFIDVAEKGTEAAAATAVVMKDASIPIVDLRVRVDHPFLYFLRDQPTGAILFMGRVLDPSAS